jgi:hypothetical protein
MILLKVLIVLNYGIKIKMEVQSDKDYQGKISPRHDRAFGKIGY